MSRTERSDSRVNASLAFDRVIAGDRPEMVLERLVRGTIAEGVCRCGQKFSWAGVRCCPACESKIRELRSSYGVHEDKKDVTPDKYYHRKYGWVTYLKDAEGNQIGDARYSFTRDGQALDEKDLLRDYHAGRLGESLDDGSPQIQDDNTSRHSDDLPEEQETADEVCVHCSGDGCRWCQLGSRGDGVSVR